MLIKHENTSLLKKAFIHLYITLAKRKSSTSNLVLKYYKINSGIGLLFKIRRASIPHFIIPLDRSSYNITVRLRKFGCQSA